MKKVNLFLLIGLCLWNFSLNAQTGDKILFRQVVEQRFSQALRVYESANYDSAAVLFHSLLKEYPRNHRATAAYIMGAKAYYHIGNYRLSIQFVKDLLDLYPNSLYCGDAYYVEGMNYIQLRRYEDAAIAFIHALDNTNDEQLRTLAENSLLKLTSEALELQELELIYKEATTDVTRALLSVQLAEHSYRLGDITGAQRYIETVLSIPTQTKYTAQATALLETIRKRGTVKIGVVLPLMLKSERASFRGAGVEFLEGIQSAVDEYNRNAIVKVALEIRDSERDPTIAARHVSELTADQAVSIIIGPVLSNEVFASAAIANERGVPLITPTATANGITNIGPFIFQANPDYEVRGRIAARYASTELKAKRFAVLAPSDAVGRQLVEAFIDEVKQQGGELVAQQWYVPNTEDVRSEIEALRRTAMSQQETTIIDFSTKVKRSDVEKIIRYGVSQHVLDSLLERQLPAPVELLFGPRGKIIADSLDLPVKVITAQYDSLIYPVTNIDAIFIPITSSEEIPIISAQLKYYNIQTQILGTGDWYDLNELDQNRQYTDGVIMFVDSYVDVFNPQYQNFVTEYQNLTKGKMPTTNSLLTYDVTKMILQTIEEGSTRRADLAVALAKAKYDGWHGRIEFSEKRVNTAMITLRYKESAIHNLGIVSLKE
ncbi:MAG: penicillin-binding protein activator [Bacteroidetes bacterium]|nr:penicillin-binding protein activator [Bacteroidota bacterium]